MKKLFSYLLISSMVVLSSCTNYDDQFDDLNTQINTLKSQIEGFSSLSSGLTALQGTVASLQTAIKNIPVTPATDISGLVSTQAALQTALTALATEVTALQTSLAAADSSAQVAQLALDLAAAQADLTKLLASNNVYSPVSAATTVSGDASLTNVLIISSQAQLATAKALGDRLAIVNGSVKITDSEDLNATDLEAVMAKFNTVTGNVEYISTDKDVSAKSFTSLTNATKIRIEQVKSVSLPELGSASSLEIDSTPNGVAYASTFTSISAPKLSKVTTLSNGTAHNLGSTSNLESIVLTALTRYGGSLTLTTEAGGSVDVAALSTVDADAKKQNITLTVNGPDALTLSTGFKYGVIASDSVENLTAPGYTVTTINGVAASLAGLTDMEEVHIHALATSLTLSDKIEIADFIGTVEKTSTAGAIAGASIAFNTGSKLESITTSGNFITIDLSDVNDLTTVSLGGAARKVIVDDADKLTSLTIDVAPLASSISAASMYLHVTNNDKITSLTADKFNGIRELLITGNTKLESFSLAAATKIGAKETTADVVKTKLDITGNNLTASAVQDATAALVAPVVAGSVTQASLNAHAALIRLLVAARSTNTHKITIQTILSRTTAEGAAYAEGSTGLSNFTVLNLVTGGVGATDAVNQKNTAFITPAASVVATNTFSTAGLNGGIAAQTVTFNSAFTSSITGYDATDSDSWMPAVISKLNTLHTDANSGIKVSGSKTGSKKSTYNFAVLSGGSDAQSLLTTSLFQFAFAGNTMTASLATNTLTGVTDAMVAKIVASQALSKTWDVSTGSGPVVIVKPLDAAGNIVKVGGTYAGNFTFSPYAATNATNTAALVGTALTINQSQKVNAQGWILTAESTNQSINHSGLELGGTFLGQGGNTVSFTVISSGDFSAASSPAYQVNYADKKAATTGSTAATTNYLTWL